MILKSVILKNYRNYLQEKIELNKNINFFIGENAQGKTNFIEAIFYLATGRSFRNNKDAEIINWGKDYFHLQTKLYKENIKREFIIDIFYDKKGNKKIKINGVKYQKISDLFGFIQVVKFSPDDLMIIKGGPSERRRYFDLEICQFTPDYYKILLNFHKILQQRNNLLKKIRENYQKKELIEVWDEQLITYGSKIIKNRIDFLKKIVPLARNIHKEITGGKEILDITYNSLLINNPEITIEKIKENYQNSIKENKNKEINKGITLIGPQRDDIIFYLDKKELKIYGSQGQQRTTILALKIAQLKLLLHHSGDNPLLLLDDVMSELDDNRRKYLLDLIKDKNIQTFITGANQELLTANLKKTETFHVSKGKIEKMRGI